ncbi:putative nacht domain protein [Botrytis fragariae]|uniref:Putative nacht domain protein n=1 Tax=Botrytis fragariae TaxID=1964551 RepID=A0A8H6EIC1_9HELO|nr:putative nacht domain protein [Botrytis fragariae]KAF5873286.1 putative nacht domain protein [Botrytis fragariae]
MLDILGFEARSKLHLEAALDKSPERFVTRALLNKHNKKYHALAMKEESPSLAEILAPKPEPLFMNALPVDDQPFGEVEFNNSSNGYLDVSTDFDFDKFINGSTGGGDNINFDPYLGENEINHSI